MAQCCCTTHLSATAHLVISVFLPAVADGPAHDDVSVTAGVIAMELCQLLSWDASLGQTVGPVLSLYLGSRAQKFVILLLAPSVWILKYQEFPPPPS